MYRIELLPGSSSHVTPGWSYVPDRGVGPAKAAIAPAVGRKRGIREPGGRGNLSSRQSNAIIRHLAELDRENHKDVQIPVPARQRETAARAPRAKTTTNSRRILQSQKTFRNYLDDEEAALAQAAQTTTQRPSVSKVTKPTNLRRSSTPAQVVASKPEPKRQKKVPAPTTAAPETTLSASTGKEGKGGESTEGKEKEKEKGREEGEGEGEGEDGEDAANTLISSPFDNDPLLRSYIPSAPSERIMQALLAEPPLTYNASRAGPSASSKLPRGFCCICGYWGKIRCKNCHLRTCGLGCYKVHEDSRCGAFF
ncbi:hypothetical protein ASPZODRAFT_1117064 [Penicilliopsis zonata CBS 506.65]|uniref:HIT-type domain-containing protein n=1 Tax=Penicilliopsis zonata CBS 506.65 TaxID=1073090 RepID=A0A1L9SSH8_9EURO|nr:hypothetical protein ASPZODRAFT_1117064 [Penicilliopsis zonata CBS 506.65]OJJ50160.1 hypothetical protein ASPZODRAFT_1117064 [Penicilliopsis zonata CBS 506.65]